MYVEDQDDPKVTARELRRAMLEMAAFNADVTRWRMVERLRAARPFHPSLLVSWAAFGVFVLMIVAAVGWVVLIALAVPIPAALVKALEFSDTFPAPMLLSALAFCSLAFSAATRELAAEFGETAPMLPHEAVVHQRLTGEIARLQAKQKQVARTATPAPSERVEPRSARRSA